MPKQRLLLLTAVVINSYVVYYLCKKKKKNENKKLWSRMWLQRRAGRGTLALLNQELISEDPDSYKNFLRLDEVQFKFLLGLVEQDIKKQDTFMRDAISPEHRYVKQPILVTWHVDFVYYLVEKTKIKRTNYIPFLG